MTLTTNMKVKSQIEVTRNISWAFAMQFTDVMSASVQINRSDGRSQRDQYQDSTKQMSMTRPKINKILL
jgi:hypothetical protein